MFSRSFSLVISYVNWRLDSLLNRGGVDSIGFMDKPEEPRVQLHRQSLKLKKLVFSQLIGFSNPVSGSNSKVRWKFELFPVNHVVKSYWIKHSPFESYLGDVVACIPKSLKRLEQLIRIFSSRLKLSDNRFRELHPKKHICNLKYLSIKPQFFPRLKLIGFLEVF